MNLNTVDLNLFLVFQAIYLTKSVTLAGERLCLTQSAVSNALKRLRDRFDDPLFVRVSGGMVPTPMAERLMGVVEEGLAKLSCALDQAQSFDPASSEREFRLAMNDVGQMVFLPIIAAAAWSIAPHIRFETVGISPKETRHLMAEGAIDLALGSWHPMGAGFHDETLFEETYVALLSEKHRIQSKRLTHAQYFAAEHVSYRPSGKSEDILDAELMALDLQDSRKVVVTAGHTSGLHALISHSQRVFTASRWLASTMIASHPGLRTAELPFTVRPFAIRQQWHERMQADAGHVWLRTLVKQKITASSFAAL